MRQKFLGFDYNALFDDNDEPIKDVIIYIHLKQRMRMWNIVAILDEDDNPYIVRTECEKLGIRVDFTEDNYPIDEFIGKKEAQKIVEHYNHLRENMRRSARDEVQRV